MITGEMLATGLRNAFIAIGFVCIFFGVIARGTNQTNRGLGMALIVVGAFMIAAATLGRLYGWW